MSKVSLTDVGTLTNDASARQAINANTTAIEEAFDNTLSRDGSLPNHMEADIDLNSNDLLNVRRIDAFEFYKNGIPWEQSVTYGEVLYDLFDGTGAQTAFTLQRNPGSIGNLDVSIAGVTQRPGVDFSWSGTTITFVVPPALGTKNVLVRYANAVATGIVTSTMISWIPGQGVTQSPTNQQFAQNGAGINRFNDRILVSGATLNDGAFPNVIRDWMSDYWVAGGFGTGPMASTVLGVANNTSNAQACGVLSAIQTKNFTSAGTAALGIFGCVFNDNATLGTNAWGGYFEAHRTTAATHSTYGVEIDTRTLTDSITPSPFQQGDIIGLQIAHGAEWSSVGQFNASAAIQLAANPMKFKVGINILDTALVDLGGGIKEAITVPAGSLISSWVAAGRSSFIFFNAYTGAGSASITLADGEFTVTETSTGAKQASIVSTVGTANYPRLEAVTATNAVKYSAEGTDTNIDVWIAPKGTGVTRFGAFTANADAPATGYVTIKTADGTVRKLMVMA